MYGMSLGTVERAADRQRYATAGRERERERELILTPIFCLHSHSSPAAHPVSFASSTLSLSGQSSAGAAFNPEGCHNFICWRRRLLLLLLLLLLPLPMASSSASAAAAPGCKGLIGALEVGGEREWD